MTESLGISQQICFKWVCVHAEFHEIVKQGGFVRKKQTHRGTLNKSPPQSHAKNIDYENPNWKKSVSTKHNSCSSRFSVNILPNP